MARAGRVNTSYHPLRNNLERDQLQIDTALVPHQVHVAASSINETFPCLDERQTNGH
jgi:hypothetical protein